MRHLSGNELDQAIKETQKADETRLSGVRVRGEDRDEQRLNGTFLPAKARTARCAGEQDCGGGRGAEGGYAVGLWPAQRAGILWRCCHVPTAREKRAC